MYIHLRVARTIAQLLDSEFKLFNFSIGLDPLLGLIPGIGDFISFGLSLYIVWVGFQMKLPKHVLSAIVRNVVFDLVLGLIPIIGDVGDFFFKANKRNMALLEQYVPGEIIEGRVA
ncbi:hypothetical protein BH11PAT1_BH11PAT1_2410 [soil metagenome]